jgi:PAS domain S-box-containing protein
MKDGRTSIRTRLMAMSALSSSFALLLACFSFLGFELITFRKSLVDRLTAHARVLAFNVTAPLLFDDADAAISSLVALKAMPGIRSATLSGKDGKLFAAYGKALTEVVHSLADPDGLEYRFEPDRLLLSVPVISEGAPLGMLTLESTLDERARRVRRYLLLTGSTLFVSIVAALAMSAWLQRRLLLPILRLTDAARLVSERGDYSVRVDSSSQDELGLLAATFNNMLRKIEEQNQALREESEKRFHLLVEGVKDYAIIMLDAQGQVQTWNTGGYRLYGYEAPEVVGQHFRCFYLPADIEAGTPERELQTASAQGRAENEGWRVRKDGVVFWANAVVTPVMDSMGQPRGFAKIVRDMTERRRTEEALRQAKESAEASNRELEAFSYSVAHDLRAPLRSIDGFSNVVLESSRDVLGEKSTDYLRRVRAASQRMAVLIDGLLDLARLTRIELHRQPVDLSAIAAAVAAELQAAQPSRNVELKIADALLTEGDPVLLRVVLSNLLGNAWKFTAKREPAVVEFGARQRDGVRTFFVRDNGAGFNMTYANKLFGAFQRLHQASEFEGTGIGLTIVQRILNRHGGKIWAEAEEGQGATFLFTLG